MDVSVALIDWRNVVRPSDLALCDSLYQVTAFLQIAAGDAELRGVEIGIDRAAGSLNGILARLNPVSPPRSSRSRSFAPVLPFFHASLPFQNTATFLSFPCALCSIPREGGALCLSLACDFYICSGLSLIRLAVLSPPLKPCST